MNTEFIIIFIVVTLLALCGVGLGIINIKLHEEIDERALEIYNLELEQEKEKSAMLYKDSHTLSELVEGIGGVQSVSLSPKVYIELLKAKEELTELRLTLKGAIDDN